MSEKPPTKHFLFTVDVEDWFQVENFKPSIPFDSWDGRELRVERNTHKLLDLFDEANESSRIRGFKEARGEGQNNEPIEPTKPANQSNNVCATFFVLGWIARKCPGLVREIHNRGHEVASHGIEHHLCNTQSASALRSDLVESKNMLEDILGQRVHGYRAPSFSVNDEILKIIQDAGYSYDSSYNSFDRHGRYGRLSTNGFRRSGIAYKLADSFYELPVSNLTIQNSKLKIKNSIFPWGGGGYFRLIPYAIFRKGLRHILNQDGAYSFYLHPWEIDPGQPRVKAVSASFKFRHYINLGSTEHKLRRMLKDFSDCCFVTCREYLEAMAKD